MFPTGSDVSTTPRISARTVTLIACGLFAAKIVLFYALALNTRFVLDEFWQFGQARDLGEFYVSIWPVKAPGYVLAFWPAWAAGGDSATMFLMGRALAATFSLLTCWFIWRIACLMGTRGLVALLALVLLFSASTWMERAFRLRAEVPALMWATLALWLLVRHAARPSKAATFAAGVIAGMAFLTTQKGLYFDLALGLGLCVNALFVVGWMRALHAGVLLLSGWILAVAAFCVGFGGDDALSVARNLVSGPSKLALEGGTFYRDLHIFILETLKTNWILYGFSIAGLALALANIRRLSPERRVTAVFTLVITVLVFRHNQPWPYIFIWVLPFLILWIPVAIEALSTQQRLRFVALSLLGVAVLVGVLRDLGSFDYDNREQLAVVRAAETLVPEGQTYFDGIGSLPSRDHRPRRWLDAQGVVRVVGGSDDLLSDLMENPPYLILGTRRIDDISGVVGAWIAANYRREGPGLWVRRSDENAVETSVIPTFNEVLTN